MKATDEMRPFLVLCGSRLSSPARHKIVFLIIFLSLLHDGKGFYTPVYTPLFSFLKRFRCTTYDNKLYGVLVKI